MANMTIESAIKKIQRLEKRIDKLKLNNQLLRRRIACREDTVQEAAKILNAMKLIADAVKGNNL